MRRSFFYAAVAVGSFLACVPQKNVAAAESAVPAAASVKKDGRLNLQSGDAAALSGSWNGIYVMDSGSRGETKLNLTPTSATTVKGYFEYFWGSDNYDRFPEGTGTLKGEIKPDGKLHFGDWDLALEREGSKLIFKTRQPAFGDTVNFRWRKSLAGLPSEGVN